MLCHEQLQPALDANPQENYDIFIKLVSSAKTNTCRRKLYDSIKRSIIK